MGRLKSGKIRAIGFGFSPEDCEAARRHRDHNFGYMGFFDYAEKKKKEGIFQDQCKHCGLWVYPEFQGKGFESAGDAEKGE